MTECSLQNVELPPFVWVCYMLCFFVLYSFLFSLCLSYMMYSYRYAIIDLAYKLHMDVLYQGNTCRILSYNYY